MNPTATTNTAAPIIPLSIEEAVGLHRKFEFYSRAEGVPRIAHKPVSSPYWQVDGRLGSWNTLSNLQRFFQIDPASVYPLERISTSIRDRR